METLLPNATQLSRLTAARTNISDKSQAVIATAKTSLSTAWDKVVM
jgi:hypothetical protein